MRSKSSSAARLVWIRSSKSTRNNQTHTSRPPKCSEYSSSRTQRRRDILRSWNAISQTAQWTSENGTISTIIYASTQMKGPILAPLLSKRIASWHSPKRAIWTSMSRVISWGVLSSSRIQRLILQSKTKAAAPAQVLFQVRPPASTHANNPPAQLFLKREVLHVIWNWIIMIRRTTTSPNPTPPNTNANSTTTMQPPSTNSQKCPNKSNSVLIAIPPSKTSTTSM